MNVNPWIITAVILVIGIAVLAFLYYKGSKMQKEQAEQKDKLLQRHSRLPSSSSTKKECLSLTPDFRRLFSTRLRREPAGQGSRSQGQDRSESHVFDRR